MAPKRTLKLFKFTGLVAIIVARFSRLLNSPCQLIEPDGSAKNRQWLGNYGERVAADWLRTQGCKILAKNFRGPKKGEVDIIARHGKLLLFVEVKTRREGSSVRPYDAVNRSKQSLIEKGANAWLKQLGTRNLPWRFDIIEIYVQDGKLPRIHRIENAF
jgi:putative endonuclease